MSRLRQCFDSYFPCALMALAESTTSITLTKQKHAEMLAEFERWLIGLVQCKKSLFFLLLRARILHVPRGQYGTGPGELEVGIILQNWILTSTVQTSYWKTLIHLWLMCWTWSFFSVLTSLLSIFKHWHLTDLFILKVDFVPVEALQPLLCITLSGEQTDCKDGCLPEVSGSLSVISPFSFF